METAIFRNCFACDYKEVTQQVACPRCGKPLQSESAIRMLGGVLAFLGFWIIGIMTFAVNKLGSSPRIDRPGHYGENAANTSFDGIVYYIAAAVFIMGASTVLAGGWMLVTGRRNLKLLWFMIAFGIGIGAIGYVFRLFVS